MFVNYNRHARRIRAHFLISNSNNISIVSNAKSAKYKYLVIKPKRESAYRCSLHNNRTQVWKEAQICTYVGTCHSLVYAESITLEMTLKW